MAVLASEIDTLLQRAARIAADYLESSLDRDQPIVAWRAPEELEALLQLELPRVGRPLDEVVADAETFLRHSVRTGHPRFFNQLFNHLDPAAVLGEWLAAVANSSMYTYEAAPVFTLMEEKLGEKLCSLAGFDQGEALLNPGGSVSNLMAMLAARNRSFPRCRVDGFGPAERPAVFASEEAHYSIARAASICGFGLRGARAVPCDEHGAMVPAELERAVERAAEEGLTPFFVCATSGTTMAAAYDPIEAVAEVAGRRGLWLHVDAAYGGNVLFSPAHRGLMAGVERADSVSWNPHKTMAVPLHCSALLMRDRGELHATFATNADYLFHDTDEGNRDRGDLTLQCGRRVDALKLWLAWQAQGDEGYRRRVEHAFESVAAARRMVLERDGLELVREPRGCNLLFRWVPEEWRATPLAERPVQAMDSVNVELRERLKRSGRVMLNYSRIDGRVALRLVLTHPELTAEDLAETFDAVELAGAGSL
ncbi:MAG: glutamate decarboxylase [Planctomycetes bacterium]|nr:glutamate decarboxylase [Planctomycetota bacterium]